MTFCKLTPSEAAWTLPSPLRSNTVNFFCSSARTKNRHFSLRVNKAYVSYDRPILSGGIESHTLATLRVSFSRREERAAHRAIIGLLFVILGAASSLFFVIGMMGKRLLISPLMDLARQVRVSTGEHSVKIPGRIPAEIQDLVEAHNQRIAMIASLNVEKAQLSQKAAVARMTQMLAHDVRKPFSILKMGLGMLVSVRDSGGLFHAEPA